MTPQKTIVILGGGIGGVVCANLLAKKVGDKAEIILIDKNANHIYQPSFLWVLLGKREAGQIQKPLNLLEQKGVKFVQDEVIKIKPEDKLIKTKSRDFYPVRSKKPSVSAVPPISKEMAGRTSNGVYYDYLIVALGAELAPEKISGLKENGYNLYELKELERLRDDLKNFKSGKIAVLVSFLPFKCPAAPYEAAFLLEDYFRQRGLKNKIEINIFTPEFLPMPSVGPEIGKAIKTMLESRGIGFYPEHNIDFVESNKKELIFKNGKSVSFDFLIYIPPHQSPQAIRESEIANESGWIPVDKGTLRTKYENVFAIGDNALIILPSGKPLPKAGVFAHFEAEVAAENIASEIKGVLPTKEYNGWASCFLEVSPFKAGFASGNFYAKPAPAVKMRPPAIIWRLAKVLLEKWWLWKWF